MFEDCSLLDEMVADYETHVLTRLDWEKGMTYEIRED